jgi:hypothetical protein
MALPLFLLVVTLLGMATSATMAVVFWRSLPLRVASLGLVGVHLLKVFQSC